MYRKFLSKIIGDLIKFIKNYSCSTEVLNSLRTVVTTIFSRIFRKLIACLQFACAKYPCTIWYSLLTIWKAKPQQPLLFFRVQKQRFFFMSMHINLPRLIFFYRRKFILLYAVNLQVSFPIFQHILVNLRFLLSVK